jgi:hypothetical protein
LTLCQKKCETPFGTTAITGFFAALPESGLLQATVKREAMSTEESNVSLSSFMVIMVRGFISD